MNKYQILLFSVIALAVLNVACLAFILLGRPKPPQERFDREIIRSLNLNGQQVNKFNELKDQHHSEMIALDEQMKQPFTEYFSLLNTDGTPSKKDSLENALADLYKHKLRATFEHFEQVKGLCSPDQQKGFKKIVPSLMQVISPQKNEGLQRGK